MVLRLAVVCALSCLALAGCASKSPSDLKSAKTAFVPVDRQSILDRDYREEADKPPFSAFGNSKRGRSFGSLSGRTLKVSSVSDIRLRDKEVVLTFDDGPIPGKTDRVLATLKRYGVKATFLMVGQMARNYPATAAKVVKQGHSIGGHTYNHSNLAQVGSTRAFTDISTGNTAVTRATGRPIGFFRFPYLADTASLRREVTARGMIILDADIDSKDYFKLSPSTLAANTMAKIRAKRKGIILMHDIHGRTAAMLPLLLSKLKAGGYKVVALQYHRAWAPKTLVSANSGETKSRQM